MTRRVHEAGMEERRNMKNHSRKTGSWCVVCVGNDVDDEDYGLQDWKLPKLEAESTADELDDDPEYSQVDEHRVMTHDEYEQLCEENNIERDYFPW